MRKIIRKIRLYFVNCEIEHITWVLATQKTDGAKLLLRYARLKGIRRELEK